MAVILGKLVQLYHYLNEEISDPRTQDWVFMSNPFLGLAILGLYLYVVLDLGPKLMKTREPYSLKHTLIVYNAIQIIACGYIVYQGIVLAWGKNYRLFCEPCDSSDDPVALDIAYKFCYPYFVVKVVDLLDTIFFVMRKKQKQVTFLHVYHHTGMVMLSWSVVKWLPGGHGTLLLLLNSIVHMVMYFYYLLSAYDESYKKSMWWKKYVTQLQIIQFAVLFVQFSTVFLIADCQYPKFPSIVLIPQNLFLTLMFCDFYRKSYMSKKISKEE